MEARSSVPNLAELYDLARVAQLLRNATQSIRAEHALPGTGSISVPADVLRAHDPVARPNVRPQRRFGQVSPASEISMVGRVRAVRCERGRIGHGFQPATV